MYPLMAAEGGAKTLEHQQDKHKGSDNAERYGLQYSTHVH